MRAEESKKMERSETKRTKKHWPAPPIGAMPVLKLVKMQTPTEDETARWKEGEGEQPKEKSASPRRFVRDSVSKQKSSETLTSLLYDLGWDLPQNFLLPLRLLVGDRSLRPFDYSRKGSQPPTRLEK